MELYLEDQISKYKNILDKPRIGIFLMGIPGSGKSTVVKQFIDTHNISHDTTTIDTIGLGYNINCTLLNELLFGKNCGFKYASGQSDLGSVLINLIPNILLPSTNIDTSIRTIFLEYLDTIYLLLSEDNRNDAHTISENLLIEIEKLGSNADIYIHDTKELELGLSTTDYYKRWGLNYFSSLYNAHKNKLCPHFKYTSTEQYFTSEQNNMVDVGEQIFMKLPPPAPSIQSNQQANNSQINRPVINMSSYMNQYGGCFAGTCEILMADDTTQLVNTLKPGDIIKSDNKNTSVKCIVKIQTGGSIDMVHFDSGLLITPWHPIKQQNKWIFPANIGNSKKINCSEIYSIVLDTGFTSVNINGIDCITLGHGIQDDPVATHKFWGENILTILKKLPGWKKGFIELLPGCFTRCPDTGEVNGINCDKVITN